ncbi:hypothetical protein BH20ACT3_BH20ACT3_17790 [soil metagenome]
MITASFVADLRHVTGSIVDGFLNVAWTGSLLLSVAMVAAVVWYSKRRPTDALLTWGQAMAAAAYVTFLIYWFFGVVPDRWMNYAEGEMAMRSDAVLAGPGSTGWLTELPIVITKQTVADIVTVNIYGVGLVAGVVMWSIWQKRGQTKTVEVETSTYGRPLVKA